MTTKNSRFAELFRDFSNYVWGSAPETGKAPNATAPRRRDWQRAIDRDRSPVAALRSLRAVRVWRLQSRVRHLSAGEGRESQMRSTAPRRNEPERADLDNEYPCGRRACQGVFAVLGAAGRWGNGGKTTRPGQTGASGLARTLSTA